MDTVSLQSFKYLQAIIYTELLPIFVYRNKLGSQMMFGKACVEFHFTLLICRLVGRKQICSSG